MAEPAIRSSIGHYADLHEANPITVRLNAFGNAKTLFPEK